MIRGSTYFRNPPPFGGKGYLKQFIVDVSDVVGKTSFLGSCKILFQLLFFFAVGKKNHFLRKSLKRKRRLISITVGKRVLFMEPFQKHHPQNGLFWNGLFGCFVICLECLLNSAWPSFSLQQFYTIDKWQFEELWYMLPTISNSPPNCTEHNVILEKQGFCHVFPTYCAPNRAPDGSFRVQQKLWPPLFTNRRVPCAHVACGSAILHWKMQEGREK